MFSVWYRMFPRFRAMVKFCSANRLLICTERYQYAADITNSAGSEHDISVVNFLKKGYKYDCKIV